MKPNQSNRSRHASTEYFVVSRVRLNVTRLVGLLVILLLGLLICVPSRSSSDQPMSGPSSPVANVGVGAQPSSVAVGDFNGDGKPDLSIAIRTSNNVTVLFGNGGGGFSEASGSPFAVGSGPFSIAVGDFNSDGKQDLTTANYSSNNVTVLLNTCTQNTAPTIDAVGVTRQQGSPSANATIANVNDAEDLETALAVTVNGGASATVNGVTVSGISVDGAGVVTADVVADCTATTAMLTLCVTDTLGMFNEATLTVTVTGNIPPIANSGGPYIADLGSGLVLNGTGSWDPNVPCDSIVNYAWDIDSGVILLSGVTPSLTAAQISALGIGNHSVVLTVTDTYGATGTASTTLAIFDNRPFASFTANPEPCGLLTVNCI